VPLKSGGYLVINQTEALVSVDVNSGRATRERNIEATALKTNMEAAVEACRQLRLRDLAGLVVIDFIDMDESKNNRAVEKVVKDCLKEDRARVQMGKISGFGLMEISRQRRRSGVLEATTHTCEHCQGTGRIRTVESAALSALRDLELEALKGSGEVTLKVSTDVGLYILNEKRAYLARVHAGHGLFVTVTIDARLSVTEHEIERTVTGETLHQPEPLALAPATAMVDDEDDFVAEDEDLDEDEEAIEREDTDDDEASERLQTARPPRDDEEGGSSRRRRRRRGRRDEPREAAEDRGPREGGESEARVVGETEEESAHRRRRRGRRGGRSGGGGREDGRPPEDFQWTRPRVPFGEDAFVWHEAAALDSQARGGFDRNGGDRPRPQAPAAPQPQVVRTDAVAPVAFTGAEDVWVELPAVSESDRKPRRNRGGRGRGRREGGPSDVIETADAPQVEALAEAVAESAPIVAAPEEPAAKPARKPRAKKVVEAEPQAEAAPAPEPVAQAVVQTPVAKPARASRAAKPKAAPAEVAPVEVEKVAAAEPVVREPDPAEIAAPPAKPRSGWWRKA
jgi:ribonuclease E